MIKYTKEKISRLYKETPKDLQEAIFSQKIANELKEICLKNKIEDEKIILGIIKNFGYVFVGLLHPNKFQNILEKELNLKKIKAKQIASEINVNLFLRFKKSLELLHKTKIKFETGEKVKLPEIENLQKEKTKEVIDKYMEPIE